MFVKKEKKNRGDKNSRAELTKRRIRVRKLLLEGYPISAIAEKMGVHARTIERDSREIAKELAKEFDKMESKAEVLKIIGQFDYVQAELREIAENKQGTHRIRALENLASLVDKKAKTMSRFGVVPSEIGKLKVEGEDLFGIDRMMEIIREKKEEVK